MQKQARLILYSYRGPNLGKSQNRTVQLRLRRSQLKACCPQSSRHSSFPSGVQYLCICNIILMGLDCNEVPTCTGWAGMGLAAGTGLTGGMGLGMGLPAGTGFGTGFGTGLTAGTGLMGGRALAGLLTGGGI